MIDLIFLAGWQLAKDKNDKNDMIDLIFLAGWQRIRMIRMI